MSIHPDKAEAQREHAVEAAIARIVGPERARELVAGTPPAPEPRLTAFEASRLRRASRAGRRESR